jgi:hypothetical protein
MIEAFQAWLLLGMLTTVVYLASERCSGWMGEFPYNTAPLWVHLVVMAASVLTWPMQVRTIIRKLF